MLVFQAKGLFFGLQYFGNPYHYNVIRQHLYQLTMVHTVDNSLYGQGYREANQQLAMDNSELRQLLNRMNQENSKQQIDSVKKDLELNRLRRQIAGLNQIREQYNAIKETVLSDKQHLNSSRRPQPLQPQNHTSNQHVSDLDITRSAPTSHLSDHSYAQQPSQKENSLDHQDLTSVQSPPAWNSIDSLDIRPSPSKPSLLALKVMFQSTPVQKAPPAAVATTEQERRSWSFERESTGQAKRYNLRKRAKI